MRRILPRFCSRPSFCSSFCTFSLAEGAVPDVWDGRALHLGAGEVHPDAARRALDHRLSPVRLFAVAGHIPIVLWKDDNGIKKVGAKIFCARKHGSHDTVQCFCQMDNDK